MILPHLPVEDDSGRATVILAERSGYAGTPSGLTQLLKSMEDDGLIERVVRGKRTYAIRLAITQIKEIEVAPREVFLGRPAPAAETPKPAPRLEDPLDYDALAGRLLERVIAAATAPDRMQADLKSMSARLSSVLEDNDRLRSKLAVAETEVRARKVEIDGLRQRLVMMQSNIDSMLRAPHIHIGREAEQYLRELARLMRQPPNARA